MRTLEAIDRLNQLCPPEEVVTVDKLVSAQCDLSRLRPLQVLNIFYSRRLSDRRPRVVATVRSSFKTKKELLDWVYGDNRIFQDTNYVRLPSLEKRVLVSRLTGFARKRYPWLSPRLIHAYAFRPDFFRDRRREKKEPSWGPLYRRVDIPKGTSGRRRLWIPNPPLRRIQRCLLELSLNRALGELPSCVNGCRPRLLGDPEFGIFRNAAAHLGQEFVATLDIANFFPSITVDDVIPALLTLQSPMVLKSPVANVPEGEAFYWKHDAAVLVARLVTHRGRLPQGAPTSPAIANLVFKSFDEKIVDRLGADFVYTRYVDDITVSASTSTARRHRIKSAVEMERHVGDIIQELLANSSFELNARKTKATSLCTGHAVTGLRVTADVVELPRKARRRIRSLLYRIRKYGFVETACELIGGEVHAQTSYRIGSGRYSRWKSDHGSARNDHIRSGRRLSTERLAILMLKRLYPDLRIEVPDAVLYFGGDRIKRPGILHEGRDAWRDVEHFLPALWENNLYVEDDNGHTAVIRADGSLLCRMRSEQHLSFFHLAKRQAISAVELWHHLRGLCAGMSIKDGDRCFQPIKNVQSSITDTLSTLRIVVSATGRREVAAPVEESSKINLTAFDKTFDVAGRVFELANEMHLPVCGQAPKAEWIQQSLVFRKPVDNVEKLHQWVRATDQMLNETFPRIPKLIEKPNSMASTVFYLIRVLKERLTGDRFPTYELERRCLAKARIQSRQIEDVQDCDALALQHEVLSLLRNVFDESNKLREQMAKQSDWLATLAENELATDFSKRLTNETHRFIELRERSVWPDDNRPVFSEDVNSELAEQASELEQPIGRLQWKAVWKKLFASSRIIISFTTDSEAEQSGEKMLDRFNTALGANQAAFNVIRCMRNRAAHGVSYKGKDDDMQQRIHKEWVTIQNWAKQCLGRAWNWRKQDGPRTVFFDDERDMHITPLEGTQVKVGLLTAANEALEKLQTAKS